MTVLITGGAGYIGSHVLTELRGAGTNCVVLDNLTRGHREMVRDAQLVVGDVGDTALVRRVVIEHGVTAVMHFAAYAYVGESATAPLRYYANNVGATVGMLQGLVDCGVTALVFSSTCATYGVPESTPITEDHPQRPINAYGASKLMVERILQDVDRSHGLRTVAFRYFNAAGAHPAGVIGERHDPETHLIPLALQAAAGERDALEIFGTDYPTPDGTCVRDYIHVVDLARAHVLGLQYLMAGGASAAFNLGNGHGFSVRQVIETVEQVSGRSVPTKLAPRRPGDPPILVGSADRARQVLGWSPTFPTLAAIVDTAWAWHRGASSGGGEARHR